MYLSRRPISDKVSSSCPDTDFRCFNSVKERRALAIAYPQSDGAAYIRQIVKKMLR